MKFISPAVPTHIHCHSPTICSPTPMTTHHTHVGIVRLALCKWKYVRRGGCQPFYRFVQLDSDDDSTRILRARGWRPTSTTCLPPNRKKSSFNKVNIIWHPKQKRRRKGERKNVREFLNMVLAVFVQPSHHTHAHMWTVKRVICLARILHCCCVWCEERRMQCKCRWLSNGSVSVWNLRQKCVVWRRRCGCRVWVWGGWWREKLLTNWKFIN